MIDAAARRRTRLLVAAAALGVAALRWLARARVPDSYDAVGFVRAVTRFDLAAFQPHFPGYPVYVAACKLVHGAGLGALDACTAVSALASAATAAALWQLGRALAGPRAAWLALGLWAAALGPWIVGGAALSDATATALVAAAFAALSRPGARAAVAAAALMALAIGTRASYFPLALSFAAVVAVWRRRDLGAAAVGAALGAAAWLVPFVAVVGARALWTLGRTHVAGHFDNWGGTIVTRPDVAARAFAFVRGLVYDGLWPRPLALALALALVAAAAALALAGRADRRRRPSRRALAVAAVVVVPYAVWVFFGQNVLEQPRHLLPLVAAAALALAAVAAPRPLVGAALVALAAGAALPLAVARVRVPPAAVQLARHVAAAYPPSDTILYGDLSSRLMQWAAPSVDVRPRAFLSEVEGDLERVDRLPTNVLITSEIAVDAPRSARVHDGPLFCRDPRLDRQSPCLRLRSYNLRP